MSCVHTRSQERLVIAVDFVCNTIHASVHLGGVEVGACLCVDGVEVLHGRIHARIQPLLSLHSSQELNEPLVT